MPDNEPSGAGESAGPDVVDWDLAARLGARLTPAGPPVSPEQARAVVADLREHARTAREHVAAFTGMDAGADGQVLIVDRPGWVRVNTDAFRDLLEPVARHLRERKGPSRIPTTGVLTGLGAATTGAQAGALLALLSSKVLGQFEAFGSVAGRLLLVAPNVVQVERELGVDPRDFRLWVCLHEETHRVQFTAVPWLRDHFLGQVHEYLDITETDLGTILRRARGAAGALSDIVTGRGQRSLLDAMQTPRQAEVLDRLTALMSLLEGHADYVMDEVGPAVVPSVAEIRARFQYRREQPVGFDRMLRQLLGLDAKLRQYRDGARFVRAVVDQVGKEGFATVWSSPRTLPTLAELLDPAAWVARVHPSS